MTLLATLARLHAAHSGAAQPLSQVRHRRIAEEPLVLAVLNHSGEAAAPLAAMVGTERRRPHLLTVPQPRNRDLRFAFFADLGRIVLDYIGSCQADTETMAAGKTREEQQYYTRAPQILVANPATRSYLGLLGRSTRFQRTEGPYSVDASVPLLGQWLTFLAERSEYPGSALLPAMTELLAGHWATGQSSLEDANLAALMGWIDPPAGMDGSQAALAAEDPLRHPPAGPSTDPGFDNHVLQRCMAVYDHAAASGNTVAQERAAGALSAELESQLRSTWDLIWNGVLLLRGLPEEAPNAEQRWTLDRLAFTDFATHLADGGAPQPRRDNAVAAAMRLDRMERAHAQFEAQCALEDPFLLAERRTTGEAFGGTVEKCEPERTVATPKGREVLRPLIILRTADPVRIAPGKPLVCPSRPKVKAQIHEIEPDGDTHLVTLEIIGGVGRKKTPPPGVVPDTGEELCYTEDPGYAPPRGFPALEDTPWTHGGPPGEAEERDDDM